MLLASVCAYVLWGSSSCWAHQLPTDATARQIDGTAASLRYPSAGL